MEFIPIAIFWMLAVLAMLRRGPMILYLFFCSIPIGAMAVIPTEITGGLTFTATPIVSLLLIWKAFARRSGLDDLLTMALRFDRLGLLFLFWIVAMIATIFMPRLFMGEVMIIPVRGILSEPRLLVPTVQNLSQAVYLTISVMTVFAFAQIMRTRVDRQHALKALCAGAGVAIIAGLLDYATAFLPIEPILATMRTASYALATNVEVLGAKRVVGLMPEASSFGAVALGFLSFLFFFRRTIINSKLRNLVAPLLIAGLFFICWLSTSSGTYMGCAILVLVAAAESLLRAFSGGTVGRYNRQDLLGEVLVVMGLVAMVSAFIILRPAIMEPVYAMVDRMVLQKTGSSSFAERGMWRSVAFESLWTTSGLGVGLGATRSSSHLVAIFSSAGLLGGLLYCGFIARTLLRRTNHMDPEAQMIISAFRFAFIAPFAVMLLVSDADFGPLYAFGFGIVTATAIANARKRQKRKFSHRHRLSLS